MPQGSTTLHESEDRLSAATRDMHRAIVSLMEELEAVDWYQQRLEACDDGELREILRHNRDEEKEHAAMVLELIRRRDNVWDAKLREFLFSEGAIVGREQALEHAESGGGNAAAGSGRASAGSVGSLRGGR
ncbi:MAG TPA: encapsulin-associated ferritin-like protein [Methylomirabilota bacterium]|nr:encapsulin-associated ferritin-like protein [Methylomirabilota bacterium]